VTVFKHEIAALRRPSVAPVDGGEYFLALVTRGPFQPGIIDIGGLRTQRLEAVDQDRGRGIRSVEFLSEKPLGPALGEACDIGIIRATSGQVKVTHQLRAAVRSDHAAFRDAMPDIGRTEERMRKIESCSLATVWRITVKAFADEENNSAVRGRRIQGLPEDIEF